MSQAAPRLPNGGIIWYRVKSNDGFRKYQAQIEGNKLVMLPTSMTLLRGKTTIDLTQHTVQIIPPARVTVRGRSSSPSGSGSFRKEASLQSRSDGGKRAMKKSEEDRFHNADVYLSLLPLKGDAEAQRLVLRARDGPEAILWMEVLCQASGRTQTKEDCFPFGNPLEERTNADNAAAEKTKEDGADGSGRTEHGDGETTSSSATSSEEEEGRDGQTDKARRRRQKKRSNAPRSRSVSLAFDDIPLVKATSVSGLKGKKDRRKVHTDSDEASPPTNQSFMLTLEEASTDEDAPKQLLQSERSRKTLLVSSTEPIAPQRWLHSAEPQDPYAGEHPQRRQFLERLWARTQDRDEELVYKHKERVPLESDFASETISSVARSQANNASYLFDQADQRTVATCKAAMLRNGVPVTLIRVTTSCDDVEAPSTVGAASTGDVSRACPLLALLHFDGSGMALKFASGEQMTVHYRTIVSTLQENVVAAARQEGDTKSGSSVATAEEQQTLSATPSSRKGSSASSKLLRRLSPTPSNTSLTGGIDSVSKGLDLHSPIEQLRSNSDSLSNGSLALVLPPVGAAPPDSTYHLHVFYSEQQVHPLRRAPIYPDAIKTATLGFEFAMERKAVQRILVDGHHRCMLNELDNALAAAAPNDDDAVAPHSLYSDDEAQHDDDVTPATFERPVVFLGALHNTVMQNIDLDALQQKQTRQRWRTSIVAATDVELGARYRPLVDAAIADIALDCMAYDMVQLYLQSARRAF